MTIVGGAQTPVNKGAGNKGKVVAGKNGHDAAYKAALQRSVDGHGPELKGNPFVEDWRSHASSKSVTPSKKGNNPHDDAIGTFITNYKKDNEGRAPSDSAVDNFAMIILAGKKPTPEPAMG